MLSRPSVSLRDSLMRLLRRYGCGGRELKTLSTGSTRARLKIRVHNNMTSWFRWFNSIKVNSLQKVALLRVAFFIGGIVMCQIRGLREPPEPKQPTKCIGCVWGKWEAPAQFCAKPLGCIKPGGGKT